MENEKQFIKEYVGVRGGTAGGWVTTRDIPTETYPIAFSARRELTGLDSDGAFEAGPWETPVRHPIVKVNSDDKYLSGDGTLGSPLTLNKTSVEPVDGVSPVWDDTTGRVAWKKLGVDNLSSNSSSNGHRMVADGRGGVSFRASIFTTYNWSSTYMAGDEVVLTKTEYDAITTKVAGVQYLIRKV